MVVNSASSMISSNAQKSSGYGETPFPDDVPDGTFYEGVEKLLEVWFTSSKDNEIIHENGNSMKNDKTQSLRAIFNEQVWSEQIFPKVHCTILNKSSDEHQDAYVLSESSCFVTNHRIILKTCGTTKCLQALPIILNILEKSESDIIPVSVYYSRKNFINPIEQPLMYRNENFQDEYEYLDSILEEDFKTKSLCLGNLNKSKWFFYQAVRKEVSTVLPDQTLEILMTDLDEETMNQFFHPSHKFVTKTLGLDKLVPGCMKHDDFAFEGCGYSSNTILEQPGGYVTMHVTPEKEHSFVSFETNYETENIDDIVKKVVGTFKPGSCSVSLVANKFSKSRAVIDQWGSEDLGEGIFGTCGGSGRVDKGNWLVEKDKQMVCLDDGYKLVYRYFCEES